MKKLKEKQKKEAIESGKAPEAPVTAAEKAGDKKKKGPVLSKVAQAALDK